MTKIKLCGMMRVSDIETVNQLRPAYAGFVFAPGSRRAVTMETAASLKHLLHPEIAAVGVFVNERLDVIAGLLRQGVIDAVQLHGDEDERYIRQLRRLTDKPVIKAFRIRTEQDIAAVQNSTADLVLLDAGGGSGAVFDWKLARKVTRPYLLAGGLDTDNVQDAIRLLAPYGVDVSSGIETDGVKDKNKMTAFVQAVRNADRREE